MKKPKKKTLAAKKLERADMRGADSPKEPKRKGAYARRDMRAEK